MKNYDETYLNTILNKIEKIIRMSMNKSRYDKVIRYLQVYSYFHYNFNIGYTNQFVENSIHEIASKIKRNKITYNECGKSIVIIDNICADRVGLIPQYLDALIREDWLIHYIYRKRDTVNSCQGIMNLLESSHNAIKTEMPSNLRGIHLIQWLYDIICNNGSKKILLHLTEETIEECIVADALPKEITRYRISLADHTYGPGVSCLDYILEFRHYGCNISYSERGLSKQNILFMPLYPYIEKHQYKGIPVEAKGKFCFLTGGAMYKVLDSEGTFFKLCKLVLDRCPNSVILFATGLGSAVLTEVIEKYQIQNRLIPIGYRDDICEVFQHCEVYIDTYPVGGGLMCQYAAQYSLPILSYKNARMEDILSQKERCSFTFYTIEAFVNEAQRLYQDEEYRKGCGKRLHNAVISKEEFVSSLNTTISTNKSCYKIIWKDCFIPNPCDLQDKIDFTNKPEVLFAFYYKLYKLLGFSLFTLCPMSFMDMQYIRIKNRVKRFFEKM